ncbi:nef attachable domain protein, partial [Chlamydia psittaci 02DC14]
ETALCSVNSSQRVTAFPSRSLPLRLFLRNFQSDMWKPIEGYGENGNIVRYLPKRSCLKNCFVFC